MTQDQQLKRIHSMQQRLVAYRDRMHNLDEHERLRLEEEQRTVQARQEHAARLKREEEALYQELQRSKHVSPAPSSSSKPAAAARGPGSAAVSAQTTYSEKDAIAWLMGAM